LDINRVGLDTDQDEGTSQREHAATVGVRATRQARASSRWRHAGVAIHPRPERPRRTASGP
ncbi:MAG TPA: hypothetical protein VFN72_14395, partial [Solirubrobacterales bacterium]|nr:hypothetical protein [Solirubrobacterales bacterium]